MSFSLSLLFCAILFYNLPNLSQGMIKKSAHLIGRAEKTIDAASSGSSTNQ